jgi:uncharacterized protein YciI
VPLFLVRYHYIDDAEALAKVRPAHREWLGGLGDTLVGSGPTADNGAALVFQMDTADDVAKLADDDPFFAAGFIAERTVTEWTLVLGRWAKSV